MADLGSILGSAGIGGAIGKAIVSLELDTKKYQAEMKAAQAQTVAGTNGMSSALASFGGIAKAGLGAAALGVVAFGAVSIKAASDLGEAVNKSNVIFGNNAEEIEKWAATGAEAFGLSKTAALDAASGFGAMLETAGVATDDLDDMSTSLVELAGDMASFNNIDPTEALEKLRSGLAGEAEPLRRFGVFLSEAAVQQEAYQSGLAEVGEELTEAQKVQARYNIVFEQTTKQQGDFARTADSIPNQLRSMKAEFTNISAEVGEKLLPVASSFLQVLKDLLPVLSLVGDALVATTDYASDLVGALMLNESGFTGAVAAGRQLFEAYEAGTISMIELEEGLMKINAATGVVFEVSDKYVELLHEERDQLEQTAARAELHARKMEQDAKSTGKAAEATTEWAQETGEAFDSVIFDLDNMAHKADVTRREFIRAHEAMEDRARELSRAMKELRGERWVNDDYIKFLSEQGPDWLIGFTKLTKEQQREAQQAWEDSAKATDNAKSSLDKILTALGDLGKGKTNHEILIHYKYVGFDPTKPGMAPQPGRAVGP